MRIFYFCPDLNFPSGGMKRIHRHVQVLVENGYAAAVLHHRSGFAYPWRDGPVPVCAMEKLDGLTAEDVVVIPEGFPLLMKNWRGVEKVVLALNPVHIFEDLPRGETWKDYGIQWVMTPSMTIRSLVQWSMGIHRVLLLSASADETVFYCPPEGKRLEAAYIPRKDTVTPLVEKMLRARGGPSGSVPFVRLKNLTTDQYARRLRRASFFVTTSTAEGVHRSVLEAMACGCICIGFDGLGAGDYIVPEGRRQNFVRVAAMDFISLAKAFDSLVEQTRANDPRIARIRENAMETASRFTVAAEAESILDFWRCFSEERRLKKAS